MVGVNWSSSLAEACGRLLAISQPWGQTWRRLSCCSALGCMMGHGRIGGLAFASGFSDFIDFIDFFDFSDVFDF